MKSFSSKVWCTTPICIVGKSLTLPHSLESITWTFQMTTQAALVPLKLVTAIFRASCKNMLHNNNKKTSPLITKLLPLTSVSGQTKMQSILRKLVCSSLVADWPASSYAKRLPGAEQRCVNTWTFQSMQPLPALTVRIVWVCVHVCDLKHLKYTISLSSKNSNWVKLVTVF